MTRRSQVSKKTSQSAAQQVQPSLRSRPFAPPLKPKAEQAPLDLQTQLENAQRFGHHFGQYQISPRSSALPPIQSKLTIGAPGDKYEQEADRVAQQVVQQLNAPQSTQSEQSVQRETLPEEEDELQMKSMVQRSTDDAMPASADLENAIAQARGSGQPLTDSIRKPMEQTFGADFSGVKIHADTQADQLNRSIQARAFTTGQDVFFRQGAYQPKSRRGSELLAHELAHVVQQSCKNTRNGKEHQKHLNRSQTWETTSKIISNKIQRNYEWKGENYDETQINFTTMLSHINQMARENMDREKIKNVIVLFTTEAGKRTEHFKSSLKYLRSMFKRCECQDLFSEETANILKQEENNPTTNPTQIKYDEPKKQSKEEEPIESTTDKSGFSFEGHKIFELEGSQKTEIQKKLIEWKKYVEKQDIQRWQSKQSDSKIKKRQMGKEFYEEKNEKYRSEHKKVVQTAMDLDACANELKEITEGLNNQSNSWKYLVAYHNGAIQGILQISESGWIANLVVNPYYIVPPQNEEFKVKNTLKALMQSAVQWNMIHRKVNLELYALTTRVKKIYDNYGFRAIDEFNKSKTIERPLVKRILERGISYGWKMEKGEKTAWHSYSSKNMRIDLQSQELLLKGQYEGYLIRTEKNMGKSNN